MSVMKLSAKMDRTDGGTPWGFRMAGGKDFGSPLIIQRVNPGSLAAKCGLQEGDTIVRIGRTPADGLRHKEAQNAIVDAGNSLELAIERSSGHGYAAPPSDHHSSYAPSPASFGGPRPYNDGVGSLSSQLGSVSIGSPQPGIEDGDRVSMKHDAPTRDLHASSSLHDSFTAEGSTVDQGRASPLPPPLPENPPPPLPNDPPPSHSAIYDDQSGEDHPRYRGFQDPGSQSKTFKKLQNLIETGQDVQTLRSSSPVGNKPTVGVKPVFPPKPANKTAADVTPAAVAEQPKDTRSTETSVG